MESIKYLLNGIEFKQAKEEAVQFATELAEGVIDTATQVETILSTDEIAYATAMFQARTDKLLDEGKTEIEVIDIIVEKLAFLTVRGDIAIKNFANFMVDRAVEEAGMQLAETDEDEPTPRKHHSLCDNCGECGR